MREEDARVIVYIVSLGIINVCIAGVLCFVEWLTW